MNASVVIERFKSELQAANAIGKGFSKKHEKTIRYGISRTTQIANSFVKMLKEHDFGGLDDFFFAREDLIPGGKEYWFFDVVSTTGDKTQLVLTFGCSDAKALVNSHVTNEGNVAAVGWFYSNKKKVFLEKSLSLKRSKGLLKTNAFTFSGAYPSYDLVVGKKTRLHFTKPKKGVVYEAHPCTAKNLGVGMLTMYLDVTGVIDGKPFKGVGYVQKVVLIAPFIPWNWLRVVFKDKSVLDVFVAKLSVRGVEYRVVNKGLYRLASGKSFNLSGSNFKKLDEERWLLEGNDFSVHLKTYAFKPFVLKGRGEFHYDEYLVECTDFMFNGKNKHNGLGMLEDAYGFMI